MPKPLKTPRVATPDCQGVFGQGGKANEGIEQARKDGKPHGRPMTAGKLVGEMKQLLQDGLSKRAIAKRLGVSRPSVIRLLRPKKRP